MRLTVDRAGKAFAAINRRYHCSVGNVKFTLYEVNANLINALISAPLIRWSANFRNLNFHYFGSKFSIFHE